MECNVEFFKCEIFQFAYALDNNTFYRLIEMRPIFVLISINVRHLVMRFMFIISTLWKCVDI